MPLPSGIELAFALRSLAIFSDSGFARTFGVSRYRLRPSCAAAVSRPAIVSPSLCSGMPLARPSPSVRPRRSCSCRHRTVGAFTRAAPLPLIVFAPRHSAVRTGGQLLRARPLPCPPHGRSASFLGLSPAGLPRVRFRGAASGSALDEFTCRPTGWLARCFRCLRPTIPDPRPSETSSLATC